MAVKKKNPLRVSYSPSDAQIELMLNNLTIEEKVGQMSQLGIDDFVITELDTVNPTFAELALNHYLVGSVLNTYCGQSHTPQPVQDSSPLRPGLDPRRKLCHRGDPVFSAANRNRRDIQCRYCQERRPSPGCFPRLLKDFGEDPDLSGQLGAAMVSGFQGADPHNIGNRSVTACGNPISGKLRTPACRMPKWRLLW
jgi:hypothetical protein